MAIQSNFPAIKPTLLLDFANTEELDSRVTFTRASTATYYGTQTAKAEENLLLQSQTLTAGVWGSINATVTADTAVAPDGTTTADTVTDDTNSQAHVHAQNMVTVAGLVYTLSFFLKASTNNFAVVTLSSATIQNYITAVADLSTGAITQTSTGTSATFTSSSITSVGSGWYRVAITGSCTAGFSRVETGLASAATGNTFATNGRVTYTGTGTSIFAWGAQLEQRSAVTAYTPTTTQPITNYIPVLETAASGVARFDHNPTTFESLGLEIEESRTNLLTYSEEFDNAAWTKTNATITANTIVSPDGTVDADKLVEDTATSSHGIFSATAPTTTIGVVYTVTVFAKKAERNFLQIFFTGGHVTGNPRANYDLNAGTLGTVDSGITATITAVGNGWYRCVATVTAATTALRPFLHLVTSSSAARNESYTGNGTSGIYIWGAQLEAGAFATSYIPTVASQVTRAADAASMTGANFSSWYNAGQGTLYSEASTYDASVVRVAISLNDGATPNRILTTHGAAPKGFVAVSGVTQMSQGISSVAFTNNTFSKMSVAYADNNGNAAANGTLGTLDTAMTIPAVTQLQLGTQVGSLIQTLNGTIKKLAYYPLRVTDTQLQALTS